MSRPPAHPLPANPASTRRRLPLLLLALLYFGPLLLAVLIYYGSNWRPPGHTNHGSLIEPPRPLPGATFIGKWSLVYVGSGACDSDCRKTLYFMRQTHLGLGQLYTRVQRVFVVTAQCCDRDSAARGQPGLLILDAANAAHAQLAGAFPLNRRATTVFLVDPRGNLMMRYDSNSTSEGFLTDLKQLLGLSSIG